MKNERKREEKRRKIHTNVMVGHNQREDAERHGVHEEGQLRFCDHCEELPVSVSGRVCRGVCFLISISGPCGKGIGGCGCFN